MTISTTENSQLVAGNGASYTFAFSFVGDSSQYISVTYLDALGNQTVLNPSQYTLTLATVLPNQLWGIGGTVTYPLTGAPIAAGTYLLIERTLPFTQPTTVRNQGNYYAQVTEYALDTLEMQIQQVEAQVQRSIQIPAVDTGINVVLPSALQRANKYVSFDANGNVIVSPGTGGGGGGGVNTSVDVGFTNFVVPGLTAPTAPATGLAAVLPAGQAVLNNVLLTVPAVVATFADNSVTDYYLNPSGSAQPWTIVVTPLSNYTAATRYPALIKVWTIQASGGNITGVNMMAPVRPVYPQSTDFASVVGQVSQYYLINSGTAWSAGASVTYGQIISTTAGNLYQVFTNPGGTLGTSAPTGTATGYQTNGTVQLGYYGQTSFVNNFRYSLSGGIQTYFSNILAGLICNLTGTSGTKMAALTKNYLISQFKHCITNRQNSAAYAYGQKVIAGGYIWLNQTVAGGTTSGSSPFSGSYVPGTSTVVDGTITWLCIYTSYSGQQWFWMETDRTMLIYQPSDAHDSDASTLLSTLAAYVQNTWDWQWLFGASPIPNYTYLQCLQNIYDLNLSTLYNSLTPTFQQNINPFTGASFTYQYLEDNCESYSGFNAAAYIFNLLGDSTRNGEAVYGASQVSSAIFGMLNLTTNVWGWYYGDPQTWIGNTTLAWYPWYQAQFFPELHQVASANDAAKQGARKYVMQYWNNWPSDPGLTQGLPSIYLGYVSAKYWQNPQRAQTLVDLVETIFLANGLIASDFGYYIQTKAMLVPNSTISTPDAIKITYNGPSGATFTSNQTRLFTASSGACNLFYGDFWVGINRSVGAATTVNLPVRATLPDGYLLVIKDVKGDASTNNITLTPDGGNIDGSGTFVIGSNYESVDVRYNQVNNQWYIE